MSILVLYLALLVQVVLHEAGHMYAMRKAGVRVVEAGLGLMGLPPKLTVTDRTGFRWTLSPWLLGAYVKPHDDDWSKIENGPYKSAAWQFNAGIVVNLGLGCAGLAAGHALQGHLVIAAGWALGAVLTAAFPKAIAAYAIPAAGPLALALFLWVFARAVNAGEVVGITGLAQAAPASLSLPVALRLFGALGLAIALLNAVPLVPTDNGRVWDRLLHGWFGHRTARVFQTVGISLMGAIIVYAVLTDLLNIAGMTT